ncbi:predicted protein [Verticillium alfalfae VaMs.102]|uniref:Predicted protein n=1 Tax=Verticillium alfalfae (strain VaMs.102 / ATCC MYA-4576 / FGSC 10136) TaxID=526221 RepID=C9SXG6_VERA1|nr:predicted protein [Verticillium alfalfae VaMs.102]EEY23356.1 predicted protein [Verticillium alfalfae VaMs.102]
MDALTDWARPSRSPSIVSSRVARSRSGFASARCRRRRCSASSSRVVGASVDFFGPSCAGEPPTAIIAMWLADDDQAEMIERREKGDAPKPASLTKPPGATKKKGRRQEESGRSATVSVSTKMYHRGAKATLMINRPRVRATPVAAEADAKGTKKRRGGATGKKAKSMKQRLAIADGQVDG